MCSFGASACLHAWGRGRQEALEDEKAKLKACFQVFKFTTNYFPQHLCLIPDILRRSGWGPCIFLSAVRVVCSTSRLYLLASLQLELSYIMQAHACKYAFQKHFLERRHNFWDKSRVGHFQPRVGGHSRFHWKEWAASVNWVVSVADHIFNKIHIF